MNSLIRIDTTQSSVAIQEPVLLSPQEGLQQELELLDLVANNCLEYGFRIWRCRRAMVVPTSVSRNLGFELASRVLAEKGWPVIIRKTGGDLVPQSPGLLNVSLVFRQRRRKGSIDASYQALCRPLIAAFKSLGIDAYCASVPGAFCDGDYNLVVDGQKLAGTAQRWRRITASDDGDGDFAVLVHAVILCRDELPELWGITNDFYRHCSIDRYIEYTKHVSVSELLSEPKAISDQTLMSHLSKVISEKIKLHFDVLE
ncbi:MAG: lipoate--protein ligase family protein [Motiliproteus sp.]